MKIKYKRSVMRTRAYGINEVEFEIESKYKICSQIVCRIEICCWNISDYKILIIQEQIEYKNIYWTLYILNKTNIEKMCWK